MIETWKERQKGELQGPITIDKSVTSQYIKNFSPYAFESLKVDESSAIRIFIDELETL